LGMWHLVLGVMGGAGRMLKRLSRNVTLFWGGKGDSWWWTTWCVVGCGGQRFVGSMFEEGQGAAAVGVRRVREGHAGRGRGTRPGDSPVRGLRTD
jgi:hypothetical protein